MCYMRYKKVLVCDLSLGAYAFSIQPEPRTRPVPAPSTRAYFQTKSKKSRDSRRACADHPSFEFRQTPAYAGRTLPYAVE